MKLIIFLIVGVVTVGLMVPVGLGFPGIVPEAYYPYTMGGGVAWIVYGLFSDIEI